MKVTTENRLVGGRKNRVVGGNFLGLKSNPPNVTSALLQSGSKKQRGVDLCPAPHPPSGEAALLELPLLKSPGGRQMVPVEPVEETRREPSW